MSNSAQEGNNIFYYELNIDNKRQASSMPSARWILKSIPAEASLKPKPYEYEPPSHGITAESQNQGPSSPLFQAQLAASQARSQYRNRPGIERNRQLPQKENKQIQVHRPEQLTKQSEGEIAQGSRLGAEYDRKRVIFTPAENTLSRLPTNTSNLVLPSSGSFSITINPGPNLQGNPAALEAFRIAAAKWEEYISDPIQIQIDAEIAPLGPGILGGATPIVLTGDYASVRDAMESDAAAENDDAIVSSLPAVAPNYITPQGISTTGLLAGTKANFKALAFQGLDTRFGPSDGSITFSSDFEFDFNDADGISPGLISFTAVATHEIGHILGFISSVDDIDSAISAGLTDTVDPFTLDLFRFKSPQNPATSEDFQSFARDLTPGGQAFWNQVSSWEGTSAQYLLSTGNTNGGDGRQASHWKDSLGIGIMDPTLTFGELGIIRNSDLRAFDLIGYDINVSTATVPSLAIAATDAAKQEGDSGNTAFTFTVTRSGDTSAASSAAWAVTGTGANPADANDFGGTLPSGTVSFAAGETSQTITVNVSGDTTVENDESFNLTLSNPTNSSINTASATGTIRNDDTPLPPTLDIAATSADQNEGDSGNTAFTFTVTRSGDTSAASSAAWAVTGTGANPADANDFGGTLPSGTVSFAAGETSQTITVNVSGDTTVENDESFNLTLSNPTNSSINTASATGTIGNDDSNDGGGGVPGSGPVSGGGGGGTTTTGPITPTPTPPTPEAVDRSTPSGSKTEFTGTNPDDPIVGDSADNRLVALVPGSFRMEGLEGADDFVFGVKQKFNRKNADIVVDFDSNEGDELLLDSNSFTGFTRIRLKTVSNKKALKKALASKATIVYYQDKGQLFYNSDGKRKGAGDDGGQFATIENLADLTGGDFRII